MERVALVTGGTRGIGEAISCALSRAGMKVAATFVSDEQSAQEFSNRHNIAVFRWDVSDPDACIAGVARIEDALGPIDVLVNNAGIISDARITKMDSAMFSKVIRVNLGGCFNMAKAVYDGMASRGFGRIVNISSVNGQSGQFGQSNYSAAKAGIIGLTKSLALEGASRGITVNAVAPGYIETEMVASIPKVVLARIRAHIPIGRLGQPEEIARAVSFLADEGAGFITGSTLSVNGGMLMS